MADPAVLWCDRCCRPVEGGPCAFCAAAERGEQLARMTPSKDTLLRRLTRGERLPRGVLPTCRHCGLQPRGTAVHSHGGPQKAWLEPWGHACAHGEPCPSAGLSPPTCALCLAERGTRKEPPPMIPQGRLLEHAGRRQTIGQWARETGLPEPAIRKRIKLGWPIERVLTAPLGPARSRSGRNVYAPPNGVAIVGVVGRTSLDIVVELAQRLGVTVVAREPGVFELRAA